MCFAYIPTFHPCLCNQALAEALWTSARIECLYCRNRNMAISTSVLVEYRRNIPFVVSGTFHTELLTYRQTTYVQRINCLVFKVRGNGRTCLMRPIRPRPGHKIRRVITSSVRDSFLLIFVTFPLRPEITRLQTKRRK